MHERIAIVSFAGRFPGAGSDLARFWANVVSATDCSQSVPAGRWTLPPDRCTDPRIANTDTVYSTRGYYLDPFEPDLTGLDLDAAVIRELDPLVHLVLDVGHRAWRGAQTDKLNRDRVGVVLGNICLPTDRANDLCRAIFGKKAGLPQTALPHPLNRYVAGLPAGLLAKGLRLGGSSFTLDAACASSLYAVKLACDELLAGRADAMLAGGGSRPDCQYTQMGFAQLRALATERCYPFDTRADGLVVGEGAGIFVLKRLTDARKQGDTIHGIIAGIGLSNDMHGNLLAPAKEGQLRAMRAAYRHAGWEPQWVDVIECHATGTPVGDAVEFDSLRELWGETGWQPGQCVIGSVKSNVGHLLTGAGAAGLAKILLALQTETLPPQANFANPAPGLRYAGSPFRVLSKPERWNRRSAFEPRRAAVSGFGFGGVNAHVLIEEWTEFPGKLSGARHWPDAVPKLVTAQQAAAPPAAQALPPPEPVAVIGLAAHIGPWTDARALQEHMFGSNVATPNPKIHGWGLASEPCPPGYLIDELHFPIDRFRIPPKELEETLPQQLLMLQVAADALDDAARGKRQFPISADNSTRADNSTTGTFIGLGLDLNTTNFHLRWSALACGADPDGASPPLTANRTMGALASITASRIARAFHFGGPSHTVCSEEGSSARAVELGVRALQRNELDRVLVGGVDLMGDPRLVLSSGIRLPADGAVALVLKRLADAERDGDRIYAVIKGVGVAAGATEAARRAAVECGSAGAAESFDAVFDVGNVGAASGAASLLKACLALYQEVLPGDVPRYWLHNRASGPRQAVVNSSGADGSHFCFLLEEYAGTAGPSHVDRAQPLGARQEAVFVIDGNAPADLAAKVKRLHSFAAERQGRNIEAIAREWFRTLPPNRIHTQAVAFVARTATELLEQTAFAAESLGTAPDALFQAPARPGLRDRIFYASAPLGPKGKLAFVFPGSGNQFDGMGRELSVQWPEVLRRQSLENARLRDQFAPHLFWQGRTHEATAPDLMFGQVALGSLVSDILVLLGVRCDAMIGLSLGESAGLFGVRAWRGRDEMYARMAQSPLFHSALAPPFDAARAHWGIPSDEPVDWVSGIIAASPDDIGAALRPGLRAYLLIVNTPTECVIGGRRTDVQLLAAAVGKPLYLLEGVTLAHCEAGRPVELSYRELHTLPVTPPPGVTIYSGAWGKSYRPTEQNCAESITAGLVGPIDIPRVIEAAYREGVRAFVEVGPGNSCVRMISAILGNRPHLARAAHAARQDAVSQILKLIAHLAAERLPVDLAAIYGIETMCVGHRPPVVAKKNEVVVPVGLTAPGSRDRQQATDNRRPGHIEQHVPEMATITHGGNAALLQTPGATVAPSLLVPMIESAANVQSLNMQAQEAFLRINAQLIASVANVIRFQTALLEAYASSGQAGGGVSRSVQAAPGRGQTSRGRPCPTRLDPPRSLTYEQCCVFAAGKIGDVLGPLFAEADTFPTRVRLPDGPLQLVDRITLIDGEPKSMTSGRVVTEHTVRADRWYLEAGRIPTALAVESGQADLFLSSYLGIDFQTRGLAVYRLLDAVVCFHRELPGVGETIVYDIHIDRFVKQGDSWLFHFWFDGTVDGKPFITMRNGVAGFFTAAALTAGRGIVQTALDKQRLPGKRPTDWQPLVAQQECSLSASQVEALRAGDLVTAFGPAFARLNIQRPATIPGGMLRLVDRVPLIDPVGGRFGIGLIRAELDIHPDDWFLTCHFVDDQVMPGTLMYECCLHTLRIFLMRMGWIGEEGEVVYQPIPGVNSRLKCRGQVIATTRTVTYEVTVKEWGYRPEPYSIADALMSADGRPIVEMTNLCLQISGLTREKLEASWSSRPPLSEQSSQQSPVPLYDSAKILAFSNGNPSEAFGEPYKVFDRQRVIARLPGPPFQFLDCITAVTGEPFVMKAGAACEAQYTVPPEAWYFAANRCPIMPFSVLLEIALQPCGWLAAYCGSALTSNEDLSFRNLGGKATQFRPVTPDTGTLTTTAKLTSVAHSAGMIIQHYAMQVRDATGDVYQGTTYFGFFTKEALANQIGIREAQVPWPTAAEPIRAPADTLPHDAPFPAPMLRMVDRIVAYVPDGGAKSLGLVVGSITVDPNFWFFKAHFYQDPVWPGSLGLESFLQLLKYVAWKRWGAPVRPWQTVALHRAHSWVYRGQVLPSDRQVTVVLEVVSADDVNRRLTANGFLTVDGRVIYQMTDFSLE